MYSSKGVITTTQPNTVIIFDNSVCSLKFTNEGNTTLSIKINDELNVHSIKSNCIFFIDVHIYMPIKKITIIENNTQYSYLAVE